MKKIILIMIFFCILFMVNEFSFANGPSQPEFSSFTPSKLNGMVDEFSGDLIYTIPLLILPGPNGSSYPINLTYKSNNSPNQQASWVGFGWTLNTGAIVRQRRGFPDDYNNVEIVQWNRTAPIIEVSRGGSANYELFVDENESKPSNDNEDNKGTSDNNTPDGKSKPTDSTGTITEIIEAKSIGQVGLTISDAFNNQTGSKRILGVNGGNGFASISYSRDFKADKNYYGLNLNIGSLLKKMKTHFLIKNAVIDFNNQLYSSSMGINSSNLMGFSMPSTPRTPHYAERKSYFQGIHIGIYGLEVKGNRSTFELINIPMKRYKSYGLYYSGDINMTEKNIRNNKSVSEIKAAQEALMDYYRERDGPFNSRNNFLPIPIANNDDFTVTGPLMNGGFRLYSNRMGFFRPNTIKSVTKSTDFGTVAKVWPFGAGIDGSFDVLSETTVKGNHTDKDYIFWDNEHYMDEPFYFKFANDMGGSISYHPPMYSNYVSDYGESKLLKAVSPIIDNNSVLKTDDSETKIDRNAYSPFANFYSRSKRSNYIDYNLKHSRFADHVNYSRNVTDTYYNKEGDDNYLQTSHQWNEQDANFDEFTILDPDGRTFTYGLPIYNRNEREISYGIVSDKNYGWYLEHAEDQENDDNNSIILTKVKSIRYQNITPVYHDNSFIDNYDGTVDVTENNIRNDNHMKNITTVGQERNAPYAGSFLLTSITSKDYIDIGNDGLSYDDLGGYTKFNYRMAAGTSDMLNKSEYIIEDSVTKDQSFKWRNNIDSDNGWYKWREPYTGLKYEQNSLSDEQDDIASFSMGEKEIYYLESIETKTHIIFFITNKTNYLIKIQGSNAEIPYETPEDKYLTGVGERMDGFPAGYNEYEVSGSKSIDLSQTDNKLEYLQRIELYLKDPNIPEPNDDGTWTLKKHLKTVYFKYDEDYPIWSNCPDSKIRNQVTRTGDRYGKLTLSKVWTEESGVEEPMTNSLYEFGYINNQHNYPNQYDILNVPVYIQQTPNYNELNIDRWGNYKNSKNYQDNLAVPSHNWQLQYSRNFNYVDQSPHRRFDPAAWNLKEIKLPGDSEIHIQYEQDDYSFVHNRTAHVMISLVDPSSVQNIQNVENYEDYYWIDLNEIYDSYRSYKMLGSFSLLQFYNEFIELFESHYLNNGSGSSVTTSSTKILFKYLFSEEQSAKYGTANQEYFRGFAEVDRICGVDNRYVGIKFPYVGIKYPSLLWKKIPDRLCEEFYKSNRYRMLVEGKYYDKALSIGATFDKMNVFGDYENYICKHLNYNLSYLRVPMPSSQPKKGGGTRVNRIIMVDRFDSKTNDNYDQYLVKGKEFLYQNSDGSSSGVASNEPIQGDEENILNEYLKDKKVQNGTISTFVGGDKLEQEEGPIAKSLLPTPSIGYSRVVTKDLYSGFDAAGFKVSEFYTYKDFPYDFTFKVNTPSGIKNSKAIDYTAVNKSIFSWPIGSTPVSITQERYNAVQGYHFIKTNFNGKPKKSLNYSGVYSESVVKDGAIHDVNSKETHAIISGTEYQYFHPLEPVPVLSSGDYDTPGDALSGNSLFFQYLGRDVELYYESQITETKNIVPSLDLDWTYPLSFSPALMISLNDQFLRTMVNTKITTCPAILKSKKVYKDGLFKIVENVAFDVNSGRSIIQKSYDPQHSSTFDGQKFLYNVPASYEYESMANASDNNRFKTNHLHVILKKDVSGNDTSFYLYFTTSLIDGAIDKFHQGDFIRVIPRNKANVRERYINIDSTEEYYHVIEKKQDYIVIKPLINSNNYINGGDDVFVEIIRSGKKNILNVSIGSLARYADIDPQMKVLEGKVQNRNGNTIIADNVNFEFPKPAEVGLKISEEIKKRMNFVNNLNNHVNELLDQYFNDSTNCSIAIDFSSADLSKLFLTTDDGVLVPLSEIIDGSDCSLKVVTKPVALKIDSLWDVYDSRFAPTISEDPLLTTNEYQIVTTKYSPLRIALVIRRKSTTVISCPPNSQEVITYLIDLYPQYYLWTDPVFHDENGNFDSKYDLIKDHHLFVLKNSVNRVFGAGTIINPQDYIYNMPFYLQKPANNHADYYLNSNNGYQIGIYGGTLQNYKKVDGISWDEIVDIPDNDYYNTGCSTVPNPRYSRYLGAFELYKLYDEKTLTNVLDAKAQTFSDSWDYAYNEIVSDYDEEKHSPYEIGLKGRWFPHSTYYYRTVRQPDHFNNHNAGIYSGYNLFGKSTFSVPIFNWKNIHINDKRWVELFTNEQISPNGNIKSYVTPLNINSFVSYVKLRRGNGKVITTDLAKAECLNCRVDELKYFSFEFDEADITGGSIDSADAFTGNRALKCTTDIEVTNINITLDTYKNSQQNLHQTSPSNKLLIRFWSTHSNMDSLTAAISNSDTDCSIITLTLSNPIEPVLFDSKKIQIGNWYLYEGTIELSITDSLYKDTCNYKEWTLTLSGNALHNATIDDLIIKPNHSSSVANVFDIDYKPLAKLNDVHFPEHYIYNQKNELIRVESATQRGNLPVKEVFNHLPYDSKPSIEINEGIHSQRLRNIQLNNSHKEVYQDVPSLKKLNTKFMILPADHARKGKKEPKIDLKTNILDLNISPEGRSIKFLEFFQNEKTYDSYLDSVKTNRKLLDSLKYYDEELQNLNNHKIKK